MSTTESTQQPDVNRNPTGKFVKGNKAAAGPRKATLRRAKNQEALALSVNPKEIRKIMRMLIQKALEGDVAAAKEVLDRVVGRPGQYVFDDGDQGHRYVLSMRPIEDDIADGHRVIGPRPARFSEN